MVKEPREIVVSVNGGLVEDIDNLRDGVVVEVHDFDIEGANGETRRSSDGREYVLTGWASHTTTET